MHIFVVWYQFYFYRRQKIIIEMYDGFMLTLRCIENGGLLLIFFLPLLFGCGNKDEPLTCEVNGETYELGEWFEAADECNSCFCEVYEGEVTVVCTKEACDTVPESTEDTGESADNIGSETDTGTQ